MPMTLSLHCYNTLNILKCLTMEHIFGLECCIKKDESRRLIRLGINCVAFPLALFSTNHKAMKADLRIYAFDGSD